MTITILIISVILLVILLWAVFTSNNLIAKRNRVKQCRSGISPHGSYPGHDEKTNGITKVFQPGFDAILQRRHVLLCLGHSRWFFASRKKVFE